MTAIGLLQIFLVLAAVIAAALPLGGFIARVMNGERTPLSAALSPVERAFYRLAGVDAQREQSWLVYAMAMLAFSLVAFLSLYTLQRLQNILPLNPRGFDAVPADLAFKTSISFITNTNWQNYSGETTMSHLTQMLGLTVNNFVSAATGLAMAFALARGFARAESPTVGNFWVDLARATLYVLLPASIVFALVLHRSRRQPGGDQGTGANGGGFFNANSAHPFENPSALSNFLESWALLPIPFASVFAFGRMVRDPRQGRAIAMTMGVVLVSGVLLTYWAEAAGNPLLADLGVDPAPGNMEGKEVRFGVAMSALFANATTGASTGAVNAMHDSFTPLGGLAPLFNVLLGCISPGSMASSSSRSSRCSSPV